MNAKQLKSAFADLGGMELPKPRPHTWPRYLWDIRRHVRDDDPEAFLTWSTLHATMFVGSGAAFTPTELAELKRDDWPRWKKAITESGIGKPIPYMEPDDYTSGNLIHQAYHLLQWEKATGEKAQDLRKVVEFGGGYGSLATIFQRLGFEGEYVIYDNDEMSLIQQYYLSQHGFEATFRQTDGVSFDPPGYSDLLVASYSLSEVSEELRQAWFQMTDFRTYLIVHQDQYWGTDLVDMFDAFIKSRPDKKWVTQPSPIKRHRYVIGMSHV